MRGLELFAEPEGFTFVLKLDGLGVLVCGRTFEDEGLGELVVCGRTFDEVGLGLLLTCGLELEVEGLTLEDDGLELDE